MYVTVVVALDLASPRKAIPSSETFSRTTNLHTVGQRKCIDAQTELKKILKQAHFDWSFESSGILSLLALSAPRRRRTSEQADPSSCAERQEASLRALHRVEKTLM